MFEGDGIQTDILSIPSKDPHHVLEKHLKHAAIGARGKYSYLMSELMGHATRHLIIETGRQVKTNVIHFALLRRRIMLVSVRRLVRYPDPND